jgi:hypothetical protein
MKDGREGHRCKTGIGDVIQKGFDIRIGDLFSRKSEREHTDQIGHCCHHKYVKID